ncbi:MAG TPA: RNA polymerase sigma factor [Gemmatimonadota bacterium]|nr:RNA polymerase sigma factor [Gemmatimonadota bacterium]
MPDSFLVDRARRGDTAAFDALVRRYYRAAYAVALAKLGNAADAEDVCQDAFIRALQRIDDPEPARFAAWLLQIVRNRAHNYRAYRNVREAQPLESVSAAGPGNPAHDVERAALRARLEQALGGISEIQREVVLLHDLHGWKHREIADVLDISEGMSRQHLMAARRALRELLGTQAFEEYSDG